MYNVRSVEENDIPDCIVMGYRFLKEADYIAFTGFNPTDAVGFGKYMIEEGVALLLTKDGDTIGMIGGIISTCPWNSDCIMGVETWWWVKPEERGRKGAMMLLKEFEKKNKEAGVTHICLSSIPALNGSKVGSIYKRMGYIEREHQFSKEIN